MERGHGGRAWREHGEGMEREHRVGMERGRSFAAALRHSCTNPHSSACIDIDIQQRGLQPRGHSPSMHAPHTPRAPGGQGPLPVAGFASSAMSAASNVPSTIERSSLSARPNHSPSPIQSPSPFRHFPPGLPQAATQLVPPPPMLHSLLVSAFQIRLQTLAYPYPLNSRLVQQQHVGTCNQWVPRCMV